MFIDQPNAKYHAPFGGAELKLTNTCLVSFRSSERRRGGGPSAVYKHLQP